MGAGSSKKKGAEKEGDTYAELSGVSDFPPIRVLINEQFTSSAVDSLKDSEEVLRVLSKSIVMDILHDKKMPGKFGELLQYTFSGEPVLQPTRELLYWSLKTPEVSRNTQALAKWHLSNYADSYGVPQVSALSQWWLQHPPVQQEVIKPLLLWTGQQRELAVLPLAEVVSNLLPWYKDLVKEGIQAQVTESLKSEGVRQAVRDTILLSLAKLGESNTDVDTHTPSPHTHSTHNSAPPVTTSVTATAGAQQA
ncbi:hypothetical protein B484DRAFT_280557 [Ochromonadaceae sp. CCMP2298]|nr:hypothetical protein B484DRAFT_280557 [Ochromonadaceae sp. CCMP2298]